MHDYFEINIYKSKKSSWSPTDCQFEGNILGSSSETFFQNINEHISWVLGYGPILENKLLQSNVFPR